MRKITRKTLLYKSGVEYADYCLNHVEGCSHGCRFPCYAMMLKKRCGVIKDYNDWIRPKIVANALELLDQEIPRLKHKIKLVHLCFATDPFMYGQPEIIALTLQILSKLNANNIRSTILTKGIYPEILADLTTFSPENEYGITLVSTSPVFRKRFEPGSSPYPERMAALKYLHDQGLKTWVSMEPYPTPNVMKHNLSNILSEIGFVDKIVFGKLNYNTKVSQFKDNRVFYDECAETVTAFCRQRRIACHIKYGTASKDNKKTEKIFETPAQLPLAREAAT